MFCEDNLVVTVVLALSPFYAVGKMCRNINATTAICGISPQGGDFSSWVKSSEKEYTLLHIFKKGCGI